MLDGNKFKLTNQRASSLTHNDQIKSSASDWCSDIQSMSPVFLNDSLTHYTCYYYIRGVIEIPLSLHITLSLSVVLSLCCFLCILSRILDLRFLVLFQFSFSFIVTQVYYLYTYPFLFPVLFIYFFYSIFVCLQCTMSGLAETVFQQAVYCVNG